MKEPAARIEAAFRRARQENRAAFIPFLTAGDPDAETTRALVVVLARRGADLIELGIPFSDPLADGATIFLDEIGDLPLELQAKLLRVLQEGECERVGSPKTLTVNVRVIAATNRDLEKTVQQGGFRPDLYYRLNVFPIQLPALRERREDIPLLVKYFAGKHGAKQGKKIETIPQTIMEALQGYSWPGNVRELENVIERAVILTPGLVLELGEWLPNAGAASGATAPTTLEELERVHILETLARTGWRVSGEKGAAKLLGLKPTTLEARMQKLGITRKARGTGL